MTNRNTMSKYEYIFETLLALPCIILWFNIVLFKSIESLTRSQSLAILYTMIAVSVVTGICITWKKRRNKLSLFVNFLLPIATYTLIAYKEIQPYLFWIPIAVSVILSVAYIVLIMRQKVSECSDRKKIQLKRFFYALKGCRTIVAACFSLALVPLFLSVSIFGSVFHSNVSPEAPNNLEWTIDKHIETLTSIDEERWSILSNEEKLAALQTVANIEAENLGLPHELNVKIGTLDGGTVAAYRDETHLIILSVDYFAERSAAFLIDSICHESFHAYEYRLVDAYRQIDKDLRSLEPFLAAGVYTYEFDSYNSGNSDFASYYSQRCEEDAREYAEIRANLYSRYIAAYKSAA